MFSPTGLCVHRTSEVQDDVWSQDISDLATSDSGEQSSTIRAIGQGYLIVRSRLRITQDGGHSMLAVQNNTLSSRLGPVSIRHVATQQPTQGSALFVLPEHNTLNGSYGSTDVIVHAPTTSLAGFPDLSPTMPSVTTIAAPQLSTTGINSMAIVSTEFDDVILLSNFFTA
jgi:hypothetical protein